MKNIKKISSLGISLSFLVTNIIALVPTSVSAFAGGNGSLEAPYQISTCLELQAMGEDLSANYELSNNIDCSNTIEWNEGDGFSPVGDCWGPGFAGTFNGNGYVISDFYINRPTVDRQALFGCTNNGAIIENVGMEHVNITGQRYAGAFTGVLVGSESIIRNVYATGNVTLLLGETVGSGQYAGGITSGQEGGSTVQNSYSIVAVDTHYPLEFMGEGGLVGYSYDESVVSDSFWDVQVSGNVRSQGGGMGLNTAEMKTLSTFTDAGWDFDNIWGMNAPINNGYPYLKQSIVDQPDLNGDDIPDVWQPNIGGYVSPVTGKTVAMDMGDGCELTIDDITTEEELPMQDSGFDYQNGLFDFEADCGTPGITTTIKLYYYDVSSNNLIARKYNPNTQTYDNLSGSYGATIEPITIDGHNVTVVTYNITDGGVLDMDGLEDGNIADPAGVASTLASAGAISVPNTGIGRNQ